MKKIIDLDKAKKEKELRNTKSKKGHFDQYIRDKSFVARLPYPLQIEDIINIIVRMGIEDEEKILPELYKIERMLNVQND